MNNFFDTIIGSDGLTVTSMLICTAASLLLGLGAAAVYRLRTRKPSRNMFVTMLVLPVLVQAVIMLVNGSIGAGVAVMGAFSLIRFRSAPGSARDICFIFYAVCIGLATGMGYIAFAVLIAVIIGAVLTAVSFTPWFRNASRRKLLRVLIPEDLDYTGIFDDIFAEYLSEHELVQVKSTAMGTLFDLRYYVTEKDDSREKEMLDHLRERNGNLTISLSALPEIAEQL